MRFDPFRTRKSKVIIAAPELLRINALGWKMPALVTILLYGIVTAIFLLFIEGLVSRPAAGMSDMMISGIFLSALYAAAVIAIRLISKEKGPLIFTEKGIVSPGFLAFQWSDIESYTWQTINKMTVAPAPKGGGTSMLIKSKNPLMPYYRNRMGVSLIAGFGYFFDASQIQKSDAIMQRFGMRKMKDYELF